MYFENRLALVVPAFNEERLIEKTLAQVPDGVDLVYVIDDGSTDRTAEAVRHGRTHGSGCCAIEPTEGSAMPAGPGCRRRCRKKPT